jgi:transcriptional regulator with XRE-family HTH domain
MPVTQEQIGHRLRAAREAAFLTQEQVAGRIGLSRSAIAQIELGNRAVSSIELDRLAVLYGRDIRDFLSDECASEDSLSALLRANQDIATRRATAEGLRRCVAVGRELANLERSVGILDGFPCAVRYKVPEPKSRYDAIKQGASLAQQERRRLNLGDSPIEDIAELLQRHGIRTGLVDLPHDVSGLMFVDPRIGPFVVVNRSEHTERCTFSFAHEYSHVLVDHIAQAIISRVGHRTDVSEVRANAFAANFLLPEAGVRQFLAELGKGGESRLFVETPTDEEQASAVEARGTAAAHDIQLHHVALLAYHFATSRAMALYRLRNLQILSERDLRILLEQERSGQGREAARLLDLPEPDHLTQRNRFRHRFLSLALEAFNREQISRSKLEELFAMVLDRPRSEISLEGRGIIASDRPTGVSIPRK